MTRKKVLVPKPHVPHKVDSLPRVGRDGPNTLELALQKCDSDSDWTIHGLWPNWGQDCTSEQFDESQVEDLLDDMKQYWLSCPKYGHDNEGFWSHEWSKHGTCTGLTQHEFFSKALDLYQNFASDCSSGDSCDVCLQRDTYQPCSSTISLALEQAIM